MTFETFKTKVMKVRINHYRWYRVSDSVKNSNFFWNAQTILSSPQHRGSLLKGFERHWREFSHRELRLMKENGVYDCNCVSAKGGQTLIEATMLDGTVIHGEAICSMMDNFNRKLGKTIAFNRLLCEFNKRRAVKEGIKYGNMVGSLINGAFYYSVLDGVVYRVYPATEKHPLVVEKEVGLSKTFAQEVTNGRFMELKNVEVQSS